MGPPTDGRPQIRLSDDDPRRDALQPWLDFHLTIEQAADAEAASATLEFALADLGEIAETARELGFDMEQRELSDFFTNDTP